MYEEVIIIIVIITIIYLLAFNDGRVKVTASDGTEYMVNPTSPENLAKKAEMLAQCNSTAKKLIDEMNKNNYPSPEVAKRLYERCKNVKINECPDGSAGYTINKGQIICVCCEKDNVINDFKDVMFVILHELAHVMSNEYGHGLEFQENFDYITKYAAKLDFWEVVDYSKNNKDICGVLVTSGPCDNGACEKNSLENSNTEISLNSYYQEDLLQNGHHP